MEFMFRERNINFVLTCEVGRPMVVADEDKLKEVIVNLIGNSLKFTKNGSIKVTYEREGNMLICKVEDAGSGIPKDKQKYLFRRFQQLSTGALARQAGGTGLGLYIARELIRLMKGDVWLVKSAVDKGSTFAFSLPLYLAKEGEKS
jgi:signal transduction histidine kinase